MNSNKLDLPSYKPSSKKVRQVRRNMHTARSSSTLCLIEALNAWARDPYITRHFNRCDRIAKINKKIGN